MRTMRFLSATCLLLPALLAAPTTAAEIEGVTFADEVEVGATTLSLAGVGLLRYRVLFKGYVAALYLAEGTPPSRALDDVPRRLEIEYFWSIPASGFREATERGMQRTADDPFRFRSQIDRLNALYQDVRPGDRYALTYLPGRGTELALNGEPLGTIEGPEFSSALFAIWLGDDSLDDSLREQLLSAQ